MLPSIPRISLFCCTEKWFDRRYYPSLFRFFDDAHRDVITAGRIFECIDEFQRWKKNAEKKVSKPLREDRVYSFYFSFPYLFAAYVRGYVRESWKEAREGRERERRKARIVEGEGAADELIFIYANGIGGSS